MATRLPQVFVDFNNADQKNRIRLNTRGTREDLERQSVRLSVGLKLELYDGEISAIGTVDFDDFEGWVANVDWDMILSKQW